MTERRPRGTAVLAQEILRQAHSKKVAPPQGKPSLRRRKRVDDVRAGPFVEVASKVTLVTYDPAFVVPCRRSAVSGCAVV